MNIAQIIENILLGVIQGATEFIPVSSSGHLEVVPVIFGWEQPSTIIILFAHFGTLLALILYFRQDIWEYIKTLIFIIQHKGEKTPKQVRQNLQIIKLVLLATIPAGVIGYLAQDAITGFYDSAESSDMVIAITLSAMSALGAVFIMSDSWFNSKKKDLHELGWKAAVITGASQALAFVRGVSRSGISLLVGQSFNLSRVEAAKFSFLMSIPLITATSILGVIELFQLESTEFAAQLPPAIVVMVSAFVSGYLAIRYLLNYLAKHGLSAFGWYRIIFAIVAALLIFAQ